jgi:hypothetical protein
MRSLICGAAIALLVASAGCGAQKSKNGPDLVVNFSKLDGRSLGAWTVTTRPADASESDAQRSQERVLYAAVQAVAGPPSETPAIRFPAGTHVLDASVNGTTATIDLSNEVAASGGGSFSENGEFKGLVYTLTGLPGIDAVQVQVEHRTLETLPGGHLELDQPLHRSDF